MVIELIIVGIVVLVGILLTSLLFLKGEQRKKIQLVLDYIRVAVESVEQSTKGEDWGDMTPEEKNADRKRTAMYAVKEFAEHAGVKWTPLLESVVGVAIEAEVYKLFTTKPLEYSPSDGFVAVPSNTFS